MDFIYIDFEYIEEADRTNRHLICAVTYDLTGNEVVRWTIINNLIDTKFKEYLLSLDLTSTIFMGWAISGAEVPCLYQIMGYDWVIKTKWIDLWVEYKMWVLTHEDFQEYSKKDSLLSAIDCLGLNEKYKASKSDVLSLILYDEQNRKSKEVLRIHNNTFDYTDQELNTIIHYCEQDVLILHEITLKLKLLSSSYGIEITLDQRLSRGEFCMLSGISYEAGRGFPVDIEKLTTVFSNRDRIKTLIQLECNKKTGHYIYVANYKGPVHRKVLVDYSFNRDNFQKYVTQNGLYDIWEKTEKSQSLRLDEDYLNEMLSNYKELLEPIYNARNTLKQLNSVDLSTLMSKDGYIKCPPFPFHQKTSRSSPKPKLGFILNLSPWLRMLIKPQPGRAYVSIDFNSQEILIAAILSKDSEMLDSYLQDYYMSTAIKTGFAPEGATKKTHNHIRKPFKGISIGTLYGLQIKSLTIRFMALNKEWTKQEARTEALTYFENHKEVYYNYWEFVNDNYHDSKDKGFYQIEAESGWIYFMREETRPSQVQNLPFQLWGAEMMRYGHNDTVKQGIFPSTLHDSLNFECSLEDSIPLAKKVSKIMCEASNRLLGCDHMGTSTKIFTHDKPYYDERGVGTYNYIMRELGFPPPTNIEQPKEFENIHLLLEVTL